MSRRGSLPLCVAGAFLVVGMVFLSLLYAATEFDDPYIFARYARHLVEHGTPAWNVGEAPVEGFSSWIWLGVYAAAEASHLPPVATARVVGIACLAILASGVIREVGRLGGGWTLLLSSGLVLLTSFDLAFYASCGMDHIAFAVFVWFHLVWVARAERVSRRHFVIAALGFFFRPEGFFAFVAPFLLRARDARAEHGPIWRRVAETAGPGVAVYAALIGARLVVFHRLLPNAAAAKHLGGSLVGRLALGLLYTHRGILAYLLLPLVLALSVESDRSGEARDGDDPAARIALGGAAFAALSFVFMLVAGGDDSSAFLDGRLFVPSIAPLTFVTAYCFRHMLMLPTGRARVAVIAATVAAARAHDGFTLLRASTHLTNLATPRDVLNAFRVGFERREPLPLSAYLARATPPGAFIAVPWAGRVPYETDLPTIDVLGLNDAHIADVPLKERGVDSRFDTDYVLKREPFFICDNYQVKSIAGLATMTDAELRATGAFKLGQRDMLRSPILARDYEVDQNAPSVTCFRRRADIKP